MNSGRTPEAYREFFAEVFAALDAEPRARKCRIFGPVEIDYVEGEPVFRVEGLPEVRAAFRHRYLPEHPVPCAVRSSRVFRFVPTTGNRVKVRISRW